MWPLPQNSHLRWSVLLATPTRSQEKVFFGEYELDCRTGELRRNGTALKLQPQPARVLVISATRAGEVVRRQELAQQVWGSETYVDFEHGLNFAIRQIRSVLEDAAENPRFLETMPKRGYRFIAAVNESSALRQTSPAAAVASPSRAKARYYPAASVVAVVIAVVAMRSFGRPWFAAEGATKFGL